MTRALLQARLHFQILGHRRVTPCFFKWDKKNDKNEIQHLSNSSMSMLVQQGLGML